MNLPVEVLIQYGLPTVLLSILVVGIWRGSKHIASWVKPIVENVTNKHLELVDTLKTNSTDTRDTLVSIQKHLKSQSSSMENHTKELEKQSNILGNISTTMNERQS